MPAAAILATKVWSCLTHLYSVKVSLFITAMRSWKKANTPRPRRLKLIQEGFLQWRWKDGIETERRREGSSCEIRWIFVSLDRLHPNLFSYLSPRHSVCLTALLSSWSMMKPLWLPFLVLALWLYSHTVCSTHGAGPNFLNPVRVLETNLQWG